MVHGCMSGMSSPNRDNRRRYVKHVAAGIPSAAQAKTQVCWPSSAHDSMTWHCIREKKTLTALQGTCARGRVISELSRAKQGIN
jgi:hypothetical protein